MFEVVQVVFAGFSAESLAQRIVDCKPKVVITCSAVKRGAKTIFLKDIVDDALTQSAQNSVKIGHYILLLINIQKYYLMCYIYIIFFLLSSLQMCVWLLRMNQHYKNKWRNGLKEEIFGGRSVQTLWNSKGVT